MTRGKWLGKGKVVRNAMRLRWCSQNNRITEFVVEYAYAQVLSNALFTDGIADVRPTMGLGEDLLHVSADFSVSPTISGGVRYDGKRAGFGLTFRPNRPGDHLEIDLLPSGWVTGDVFKDKG